VLGAYLDWVQLQMSGKAAAEQALPEAARYGSGWPMALIRYTVYNATRSGQDVWEALTELGERIGVPQLRDLGTLVQLVAHDGAQVRDTLAARAASLRAEELAEAEGTAGKRDQSMLMAQILLGVGFAIFLGYPAISNFMRL
jgi:Flp pilus assembly protein TadB